MKKKATLGVALGMGLLTAGWFGKAYVQRVLLTIPTYTVAEIVDGDTFFTTDRLLVRLASTDAPEAGRCGYEEAKQELARLIKGKKVRLYVLFVDQYRRVDSMVYAGDLWVNKEMLEKGYSAYPRSNPQFTSTLQPVVAEARNHKRGIYGPTCTQTVNPKDPHCDIKGNVNRNEKTYFRSDCGPYTQTQVQLYQGDQWFCTEKEAQAAGFTLSSACERKNQVY